MHQRLINRFKTDFSSIFLNAGAHIQHHYFFNSKVLKNKTERNNPEWYINSELDPLEEALILYDKILGVYVNSGYKIIVMNGIQQVPFNKTVFYYRLSNHEEFCNKFNIKYKNILTRMTRDFEITFYKNIDRDEASIKLKKIKNKYGKLIFDEIEVREKSLFCSLTYDEEIRKGELFLEKEQFCLFDYVNFVGIKNGMHDKNGDIYLSLRNPTTILKSIISLKDVRQFVLQRN